MDKLLQITDALDDAEGQEAVDLILKAHGLVEESVVNASPNTWLTGTDCRR